MPPPTPDPLTVLDAIFDLADIVGEQMTDALAEHDLTPGRAGAILVLREHGHPMVQRDLAAALGCTPRHVTALTDALQDRGLVQRQPHATDRRATLVSLTPRGADLSASIQARRAAAAAALFDSLLPDDLRGFLTVAAHVRTQLAADKASR